MYDAYFISYTLAVYMYLWADVRPTHRYHIATLTVRVYLQLTPDHVSHASVSDHHDSINITKDRSPVYVPGLTEANPRADRQHLVSLWRQARLISWVSSIEVFFIEKKYFFSKMWNYVC